MPTACRLDNPSTRRLDLDVPDQSPQWEPLTGPLIPAERLDEIDAAVGMVVARQGDPEEEVRLDDSLIPPLARLATVVDDAFGLIAGNGDAVERFTTSLAWLEDRTDPARHAGADG